MKTAETSLLAVLDKKGQAAFAKDKAAWQKTQQAKSKDPYFSWETAFRERAMAWTVSLHSYKK